MMKQDEKKTFWCFVNLHRELVKKIYLTDIFFIIGGLVFLVIKIPEHIELFRAGIIAMLTIIFFTAINMRLISQHTGGMGFYRLLPLNGMAMALKIHGMIIVPVLVFSALGLGLTFLLSPWIDIDSVETGRRIGLVIAAFFTVKCMALPAFLIMRKSILVLGAFYIMIVPLLLLVSLFDELLFSRTPFSFYLDIMFYMVLLFGLEMWIATRYKS